MTEIISIGRALLEGGSNVALSIFGYVVTPRGSEEHFPVPTSMKPFNKSSSWNIKFISPFGKTKSFTFVSKILCCFSVQNLFSLRNPTAIIWIITFIAINSIQRMFGGAFSNIGKKILKLIPSFTNCYSSSAVTKIISIIRIQTSATHFLPTYVGYAWAVLRMSRVAMSYFRRAFYLKAPTRFGAIESKRISANSANCSALTFAKPKNNSICSFGGFSDNKPSSKAFIKHLFHNNIIVCSNY